MPAYYGRARRDYEPDVVYVEPRRRSSDDEYDRRAPRESERERELQDELRRTRRALLEMRQERAAVDVAERPRFVAMSPKRRGDAVQGFADRRDDYDDDEFVVVERRRRDDDVFAERRPRDDPVVVWQAPRRWEDDDERDDSRLAPLPRRDWFHDGYSRESRRYPGSRRQRYSQEGWRAAPREDQWEWCGRVVRSAPPLPPRVEPPRVKSTRQRQDEAVERLEKLCVQADERAKRAEERQEALAKELRETRRDLEQVAAAAGTPVKKKVEDDEVVDVDELKRENEALKAKLAEAEAKAAAAIDA